MLKMYSERCPNYQVESLEYVRIFGDFFLFDSVTTVNKNTMKIIIHSYFKIERKNSLKILHVPETVPDGWYKIRCVLNAYLHI